MGRYKRCFHKFIEKSENKGSHNKYITKTSCYKTFRKKTATKGAHFFTQCRYKNLSKSFLEKLKPILPSIISSNQYAYVEKSRISEGGRLISDFMEIYGKENILGYLVTMDLERAFDSLGHDFLFCFLEKFDFGDNFIKWIKILLPMEVLLPSVSH